MGNFFEAEQELDEQTCARIQKPGLRAGFAECFRVLKPGGTLVFKWCEAEIPLREVLALTPERPLYGHRSGKKARTHWCAFLKQNNEKEQAPT